MSHTNKIIIATSTGVIAMYEVKGSNGLLLAMVAGIIVHIVVRIVLEGVSK